MIDDFLTAAEKRIQQILLADDFFQNVTVLTNANGDLTAQIEQALSALGLFLCLRVYQGPPPVVGDSENWKLEIVVTENPLLSRGSAEWTGKTARFALQNLVRVLHTTGAANLVNAQEVPADGVLIWQVDGEVLVELPAQ